MKTYLQPWQLLLLILAGWINHRQQEVIEYLRTEMEVLPSMPLGCPRICRLHDDRSLDQEWIGHYLVSVAKLSLSPEGAQENSPGREPGVRITKLQSPEGATLKSIDRIHCAAPSGLETHSSAPPGLRPGLFSVGPTGLDLEFRDRNYLSAFLYGVGDTAGALRR